MSKVKVRIKAKQIISHSKTIEMDQDDFEKIKDLDYDDISTLDWEKYEVLERHVDHSEGALEDEYQEVIVTKLE